VRSPEPPEGKIGADDPRAADVRALLARHLAFLRANTPPEAVYALDVDGLLDPDITFFSYRLAGALAGTLAGVGAIRQLDGEHAELKSMHTAAELRGRGIGRAMLGHLIGVARERGCRRVSLETGSMEALAPARALYASAGFEPCGPFGGYPPAATSVFMTLWLASGP